MKRPHSPLFRASALLAVLFCLGLLPGVSARAANPAPPAGEERTYRVNEVRDVLYYRGDGADKVLNRLDLFLPEGKKDYPVLVLVHGGAWMLGDKSFFGWGNDLGRYFAGRGLGVVMPSYRLSPAVKHPEHVKDVARAVAWTLRNIPAYGGSPERLFLCGHSAGGHLVSLLATDPAYLRAEGLQPSAIGGVIAVSGVYRIPTLDVGFTLNLPTAESLLSLTGATSGSRAKATTPVDFGMRLTPFGAVFGTDPKACKGASPLTHVRPGLPPFLLICADHDLPTLPQMARDFAAALAAARCPVRLMEIKQRDHETVLFYATNRDDPVAQAIERFVRQHPGPLPKKKS